MGAPRREGKVDFVPVAPDNRPTQGQTHRNPPVTPIPFPDISPELFSLQLGGLTLAVRWYALAYIVGLLIGWRIIAGTMRRPALWGPGGPPMAPEAAESLFTWLIFGVLLGGRLGFVLFYQADAYLAEPWRVLQLWQGGMSFHGGFLGVVLATLIWARRNGVAVGRIADVVALATPPGLFLGRIANFINNELWGRPTDLPWAVAFPDAGQVCPGVEGVCGRHPSQLYEAGLEGLVLGLALWWLARRGGLMRPWLLTGVFLAGYGAARMFVETFREADAQFITPDNPLGHVVGLGPVGLSMGQLLSLPMVVLGLVLVLGAVRRPRA
jgi:phosphatidylglycerol:prolipoprotein diacylglycerol transferase